MMALKFLSLLLLIPAIAAQISIEISASTNEANRGVKLSGSNVDIISEKERNTFQITDSILKDAVKSYFGARPDDVYVRSPTPWGDLYQTYGWTQVTRTLTPQRATILEVSSEPIMVLEQVFTNNGTKKATFKANIQQTVQNTVSSTWEKGGQLTVGQDISYGFDIEVAEGSGKTSLQYTSSWGESVSKSESVTVGSTSAVTIELEAQQSAVAQLYATRGVMKILVEFDATLSGSTAVNYARSYRGHHFWSLDVSGVLAAGGLPLSVRSAQLLTLGYCTDARVYIRDSATQTLMYSMPVDMH